MRHRNIEKERSISIHSSVNFFKIQSLFDLFRCVLKKRSELKTEVLVEVEMKEGVAAAVIDPSTLWNTLILSIFRCTVST